MNDKIYLTFIEQEAMLTITQNENKRVLSAIALRRR